MRAGLGVWGCRLRVLNPKPSRFKVRFRVWGFRGEPVGFLQMGVEYPYVRCTCGLCRGAQILAHRGSSSSGGCLSYPHGPMISTPPPFKGLIFRIPLASPMKGRGLIRQGSGSTCSRSPADPKP